MSSDILKKIFNINTKGFFNKPLVVTSIKLCSASGLGIDLQNYITRMLVCPKEPHQCTAIINWLLTRAH
jgi:hypothetical protein